MSTRVRGQLEHLNKDGIINLLHQGNFFSVLGWIILKTLHLSLFCKVQPPGPIIPVLVFLQGNVSLESQTPVPVLSLFCQIGPGDQRIHPQVLGLTLMGYTPPFNLPIPMLHLPITSQALHCSLKEMKLAAVCTRCLIWVWVKFHRLLTISTVVSYGWVIRVDDKTWNWTTLTVIILLFRMCTGRFECPLIRLWSRL